MNTANNPVTPFRSRLLLKIAGAALVVLVVVGSLGYASVSQLKRHARVIVQDTLPGLAYAGAANTTLAKSYNNLLLFLISNDPEDRTVYRRQVLESSEETSRNLTEYEKSIVHPEDRRQFEALARDRAMYIEVRDQVFGLADQGRQAEAVHHFQQFLRPAFEEYHAAGETLLRYNIQSGIQQGREMTTSCNVTQMFVALIGVVFFLAGFFFGLFR
jgi:hypothetical protein